MHLSHLIFKREHNQGRAEAGLHFPRARGEVVACPAVLDWG